MHPRPLNLDTERLTPNNQQNATIDDAPSPKPNSHSVAWNFHSNAPGSSLAAHPSLVQSALRFAAPRQRPQNEESRGLG